MKFGPTRLSEAQGAILAHSLRAGKLVLKKGRVLTAADIEALREGGTTEVLAAHLEPDDVHEDEAARRIAAALAGAGARPAAPFTGRVNLIADTDGIVRLERDLIDAVNRLDESITVATLPLFARVKAKDLIATIKIIPFAAPEKAVRKAETLAAGAPAVSVAPFRPLAVAYVTSDKLTDKTVSLTEQRLTRLGSTLVGAPIAASDHSKAPLEAAIREALARDPDLVLIQGRSATVDRRDVVPTAMLAAGGKITHFGMPVDPGNLLAIGNIGRTRIIILPGCARSPKENGFDWILERVAAGIEVTAQDIQAMGVGGLLKETARGQPRLATVPSPSRPRIAGILLAAGLSRRMGGRNKLLEPLFGKPLVRHAAEALAATPFARRIVVTGHDGDAVEQALAGLAVEFVRAPHFSEGMSRSLRAGLQALGGGADAALIMLGDMPALKPAHLERLIAAFDPEEGRTICVPSFDGRRGNPVLFASSYFEELMAIEGDIGGRAVIEANRDAIAEVPMPDDAVLKDVDTPEALKALQ